MEKLKQAAWTMLGLRLTSGQVECLKRYEQELLEWNSRVNLTAIRSPEEIQVKHFLDSFTCLLAWRDYPPTRLIDVGTGAGFPGIPLKIIHPSMKVTLVESVGKKAQFCRHLVETLRLEGVEILQLRAEEVGQLPAYRESFDWAVARAVASMPVLMEYLLPLVHVGGHTLAQKGEGGPAEAHQAERALQLLGGRLKQLISVDLPGVAEDRFLVVVDKVAGTPRQYPRRPGVPSKNPLVVRQSQSV